MKADRIKDPLYFGIRPLTFIPGLEPVESRTSTAGSPILIESPNANLTSYGYRFKFLYTSCDEPASRVLRSEMIGWRPIGASSL